MSEARGARIDNYEPDVVSVGNNKNIGGAVALGRVDADAAVVREIAMGCSTLDHADLLDHRVDSVGHMLGGLTRQAGVGGVVRGPIVPDVPVGPARECTCFSRSAALKQAVVPFAAVLAELRRGDLGANIVGQMLEQQLKSALGAAARGDKDIAQVVRGQEGALIVFGARVRPDDGGPKGGDELLAVRGEAQIGAPGMLARKGPGRLAVAEENDAGHGDAGGELLAHVGIEVGVGGDKLVDGGRMAVLAAVDEVGIGRIDRRRRAGDVGRGHGERGRGRGGGQQWRRLDARNRRRTRPSEQRCAIAAC